MKIYQVCREYYDCPESAIIKTFSSKKKAEIFKNEYLKSPEWENNHGSTECVVINEHEVK